MEEGPPKTLEEAVESVRRYQRVQVEAYHNHAKRPRANVRGWSPEREEIDSWDHNSSSRGDRGSQYNCFEGISKRHSRSQSPEFRKYKDTPGTEEFYDCERARDKRDSYHVRAVVAGLETAIAELTKQVGGLTQEVRGMTTRLDSIDCRLAKVEAWEGRFTKIDDRLDSDEKQLLERAESPVRRLSPSPRSRCFACGGEGHRRSE